MEFTSTNIYKHEGTEGCRRVVFVGSRLVEGRRTTHSGISKRRRKSTTRGNLKPLGDKNGDKHDSCDHGTSRRWQVKLKTTINIKH